MSRLPAHLQRNFVVLQPAHSHFRQLGCADPDAECDAYRHGWVTILDTDIPDQAKAATYIRNQSGRSFTVTEVGNLVTFSFPPGQTCFRQHHANLGRQPIFIERDGQRPTDPTRHNADTWVDSFANHQDKIKTAHDRG